MQSAVLLQQVQVVGLSVCDDEVSLSHRLECYENIFTVS